MPSVEERPMSRSGTDGQTARRVFSCIDYGTGGAAVTAVNSKLVLAGETEWEGLALRKYSYEELAPRAIDVTVDYGQFQNLGPNHPTGSISYDFQVSLETAHIQLALDRMLIRGTPPSGTVLNSRLSIGQEREGVDILRPQASFGISIRPQNALVTLAYEHICDGLVGSVSSHPFRGRLAGEVLFGGLRGGARSETDSELRLEFFVRKNVNDQTIEGITGIDKEGWDYLWPVRNDQGQVTAVVVDRVQPRADLNVLLI